MKTEEYFEQQFQKNGIAEQRSYPNEPMLRFLSTLPHGGRVLEIGCGTGANLWAIAREGFGTFGIDAAPTAIKLCSDTLNSYGVHALLEVGNFRELDFGDGSLDAVIDVQSLQHIADKAVVLAEVSRVLKPGGKFFSYHFSNANYELYPGYPIFPLHNGEWHQYLKGGFSIIIDEYIRESNRQRSLFLAVTATKL